MNQEWTYRPPVLVGERVVWLGGDTAPVSGEHCNYQPHHGTVSWIGRVSEIGNDWIIGVEFELDMAGGCDGTWKGRQLFSCPKMRGLFLPVASVIKEKDFYAKKNSLPSNKTSMSALVSSNTSQPPTNTDLSLAPEPPPSQNKMSHHSPSIIHSRNTNKQNEDDPKVSSRCAVENGGEKTSHHHMHKSMGATSMTPSVPSTGATAITPTQCSITDISTYTSKKQLLAGRHVNTGAQDTSWDCSFSQEKSLWMVTSGSVTETGAAQQLENEGDFNDNFSNESLYFGETMIRKSTLTSKAVYNDYSERVRTSQPSISTPSSPSLSEYQRHYGKKLSSSSTSTIASDLSKCMSTPGRYSSSQSPYSERKERSGFFGIFRWFRNKKKRSASIDGMSNTSSGSMNSLSSTISSSAYSPIIRSKSADIQNKTDSKQGQFGMTRRYKLFSKSSSGRGNSRSSDEENGRRLSVISACSDTSSRPGSRGATLTRKKRPAPQPPNSPKLSDSESLKSQKSCASLPNRDLRPVRTPEPISPASLDQDFNGRKLHKSKSEGVIYSRVKRRAPLPPAQAPTGNSSKTEPGRSLSKESGKSPASSGSSKDSDRPISTVSNVSSLSQSLSSASTTLKSQKSQSSSITSSGPSSSQCSSESVLVEGGVSKQDLIESLPSPAIADTGKVSLSPRPWYKRKNKNKDTKNVADKEKTDSIYDTWMPDIQFARQKLSLGGSLKKGGKIDGKCNQAPHTPKEERKEKRKSQVSLLASISELDRAASEQMQREQENKQAQKQTYDNQFYRSSEPHFLTQTDFLPQPKDKSVGGVSDIGTLSSSGNGTIKSSASVNTEMEEQIVHTRIGLYDNLSLGDHDFTLPQSYSKQTTLKMEDREDLQHSSQAKVHPSYNVRSSEEETNSKEINFALIDNRRSTIRDQNVPVSPESSTSMTRDSPMHRATIDAELFYRLAKDSQSPAEPKVKNSPVLSGFREMKKVASTNGHISEEQAEDENVYIEESPSSPRRPNKNFGFRMNNFFSPDVSTIIEASESMTSSATTPADDIYEDLPILSVAERGRRESIQDEINSEQNCDFQLNSSDAREIMRELADVRQEIEKINEEEEKEFQERQRTKADKIREEVLHLREANNFLAWHSAVEQNNCGNTEVTLSPVNVNGEASRKFKWVCDMCTLNNTPWRLQCEACLARRPANPKRVDDDGKSLTSDFVSPQASVSNESPVTVIFEDGNNGNRECPREVLEGAGAVFPSNAEPLANEQSCPVDKKKDINWEKELQKYFRTFDEHVKGNNSGKPGTKSSKDRIPTNKEVCSKNTQKSGKEADTVASNNQVKSNSENKGAKPKIKFFGTAAGPPSTFIAGNETSRETNENTEQVLSFTIKESHTNESLQKEPDMEAIRKARLAKFQERNEEHSVGAYVPPDKEKKTRIRNHTAKNSILEGQELYRVTPEVNDSSIQRKDSSEPSGPENKMQESSFSKSYCKPQVMKPSGAVRAAVSIFNQFEQLQHANKEKPAICRRKSNSSLFERTRAFEHVYPEATSPEPERCSGGKNKSKNARSNCPREKEVFSAIAKFDEMAAIAELESIDKFRQKSKVTRRPKLLKISVPQTFQTNDRSNSSSNTVHGSPKMRRYTSSSQSSSTDINDIPGNAHHASKSSAKIKEASEGVIMDGVLYTEHRKHSMSISSSTFELIQAEDFVNIEAQHSESSTYSDSRGITDVATSSTQSSSKAIEVSGIITEHMNDDRCRNVSDDSTFVAPETRTEPQVWPLLEPKDVDRLSHQLTEADGIATFKANLRVEEPALGQTNTLHIGKLLKKLEAAISRGNHAEAAKLAHELADFRVSCSVTRNNKNENRSTSAGSSATQVNLSSNSHEARQLAPIHSDAESSGMQASSNISEYYYDAAEVMEVDELSTDDHDSILDMASVNNLEKLVQQKENPYSLSKLEDSSEATTNSFVLPQPKQILEIDSSHESFNGTEAQEVDTETETVPNMQETPKISYSPSAARREIKVDPARREVKSDTITKLPDGLHVHMKENKESNQPFYVKMYVEDKNSHQGPLSFAVTPTMTVGQLREKVCQDFGFPPEVQRWILGKRLADDDQITLEHHRVTSEGCPIFLYLVAPELESRANASKKKKVQGKSNYGENSQELGASGGVAIDKPRYLKVYDDEGNVEYRYYNPDSRRYEVSTDIDGSDGDEDDEEVEEEEEEEEEEGDDKYDDDDDDDDDDTLEEDEIEENKADMEKLYENINQNEDGRYKQRTLGYDAQDVKHSLQPPVTTHPKTNDVDNLLSQKILLNGYSGATDDNQLVTSKSNNFNLYANESAVSKEIEHKSRINLNQSGPSLDVENSNGNELAVANEKKQDNLQHKCQSQQPQPHVMQGHSGAGSSLQPQVTVNDNENSALLGKSLQKKDYDTKQNDKINQQRQIFQKEKSQISQLSEIGSKLAMKSQSQQNSKNHEMQLPSESNKQQLSEPKKQKESSHQQTPNKSFSDAQPNESQKELPSTSRGHCWVCPSCTLVNKWSRPGCEACATERPGTSHQVAGAVDKGSGLGAVVSVLDRQGYVPNPDPFECRVCFMDVDSGKGVVLRDCLHTFCRDCLANGIKYSDTADVKCPYRDSQYSCDSSLQDREIKALLTAKEYEQHLNKSVKQAEGAMQNVFHCKTPDCPGFCQFEDNVNEFHCDVCGKDNCLTCQAQHGGTTCQEYQDDLANKVDEAAMKTKKFFDDMIRRGDGLPCPKCSVMLVRKWGCDWMRCPMCRTEICWVTRGPRWGPGGPGDVSGGCKCGIRGQKCHPKCTYCH